MAAIEDLELVLHTLKVRLYKNHFKNIQGNYIARPNHEKTLTTADICTAMKTRGGFPGELETACEIINRYNLEKAYQLCDGFAVTDGFTTTYLHIGGTFESPRSVLDPEKNKIGFRHATRSRLSRLLKNISVEVEDVANVGGFIDYLIDHEDREAVHNMFAPGDMIAIYGEKIKIAGDDADNGVYLVPLDSGKPRVKMTRVAENHAGKITGIAPETGAAQCRVEIRTQYNGTSNTFLKEPRVITSRFITEAL